MGALWSRHTEPLGESVAETRSLADAQSVGKRKTTCVTEVPEAACAVERTNPTVISGEVQRYIVRCPSLFWSSKRDVSRLLERAESLPPYTGLHKIPRWDYFFITFSTSDAERAQTAISKVQYRGAALSIAPATMRSAKRRRVDDAVENAKKGVVSLQCPSAALVTAPWHGVPYREQIKRKKRKWEAALAAINTRMRSDPLVAARTEWLQELEPKQPVCRITRVLCASEDYSQTVGRDYYRNKTEFTVGMSPDKCGIVGHDHVAQPTVGYALGLIREGEFRVGPVCDQCLTTDSTSRRIAAALTDVIRASGQSPYDRCRHTGYWRQIACRTSTRTSSALISVMVSPKGAVHTDSDAGGSVPLSDDMCRLAVKEALSKLFANDESFGLYWQPTDHISPTSADAEAIHIYGLTALTERLLDLQFRVHPTAFFQVNTTMAEQLYRVIKELAKPSKEIVLLDVCCGTGTIALSMSDAVHSVVGIDICDAAIEDARYNAELNGIKNATFITARVEKGIHEAIQLLAPDRECVAVLDPPRAGLSSNVIGAVRGARAIKRVVYVSCEPNNLWKNVIALCRPTSNAFRADPFRPVQAVGVDLFPHTPHGELVMQLERQCLVP